MDHLHIHPLDISKHLDDYFLSTTHRRLFDLPAFSKIKVNLDLCDNLHLNFLWVTSYFSGSSNLNSLQHLIFMIHFSTTEWYCLIAKLILVEGFPNDQCMYCAPIFLNILVPVHFSISIIWLLNEATTSINQITSEAIL